MTKDQLLHIRISEEAKQKLRQLAEQDNRSMSNLLVVLIEKAWAEKQAA